MYVATAGSNGPTVTWTPLIEPIDPSSALPQVDRQLPVYDGATVKSADGRIDPFPELDLYEFGGYITLFPIESGIPPILTVFRDRRQDPGLPAVWGNRFQVIGLELLQRRRAPPFPRRSRINFEERSFPISRHFGGRSGKQLGMTQHYLTNFQDSTK
ncbi:S-type pyocin domain-containing protein [Pseudomonas fluorescens]|nr:S-type pyocin domain-containing protein [Pseudomonas fluorescens]